jgi:hypothetical protein
MLALIGLGILLAASYQLFIENVLWHLIFLEVYPTLL